MDDNSIRRVAELLRERNAIDTKIAQVTGRPVTAGHVGEWIASQIFDIQLAENAAAPGIDGWFRSGSLQGRSVNVKWYMKQEGLLDIPQSTDPDYYLVLTGPPALAGPSRDTTRPWRIESVYLFDAPRLRSEQEARGVEPGIASSVTKEQWLAAEIYPSTRHQTLMVTPGQAVLLQQFCPVDVDVAAGTAASRLST